MMARNYKMLGIFYYVNSSTKILNIFFLLVAIHPNLHANFDWIATADEGGTPHPNYRRPLVYGPQRQSSFGQIPSGGHVWLSDNWYTLDMHYPIDPRSIVWYHFLTDCQLSLKSLLHFWTNFTKMFCLEDRAIFALNREKVDFHKRPGGGQEVMKVIN